jgi:hypothetical protein
MANRKPYLQVVRPEPASAFTKNFPIKSFKIKHMIRCKQKFAAVPYRIWLEPATNCGIIMAPLTQESLVREQLSMITTGVVFAFLGAIVIGII